MPALLIQDFLQTQGLKLPADEVRMAFLAAQAVMNMGNTSIDRSILWYANNELKLDDHIAPNSENEALLKQIFMALDSVFSRSRQAQSAVVYAHMPSESQPLLIRLSQQGKILEQKLTVGDEYGQTYLASRTAQSGWMNISNDIPYWLSLGEISGERNSNSMSQASIPVCSESGAVLGVLHIEYAEKQRADDEELTQWVALALALSKPMQALLSLQDTEVQDD